MDNDIIYWASVSSHQELTEACSRQADLLNGAGFPISQERTAHQIRFASATLGAYELHRTDVYGHLHACAQDALGLALILGASTRNPTLILTACGYGKPCTQDQMGRLLQGAMSQLENAERQRIMALCGLLTTKQMARQFLTNTDSTFGKFCQSGRA